MTAPGSGPRVLFVSFIADAKWTGMGGWTYAVMSALDLRGFRTEAWFADRFPRMRRLGRLAVLAFPVLLAGELVAHRRNYDVVVLHEPIGFWYGLLRRLTTRLPPLVAMCHNVERHHYEIMRRFGRCGLATLPRSTRVLAPLTRHWQSNGTIRLADHVICLSSIDVDYITHHLGVPPARVTRVVNGVTRDAFAGPAHVRGSHHVVWVGGWLDVKGRQLLPRLWHALRRQMPDATMTLVGTGVDAAAVLADFDPLDRASLTVCPRVESRERMRELYASGGAYLLCSLSEGSPLSLLEAMAAGLPVVATSVGGVPDIVVDQQHGLLFAPDDPEGGATLLARILTDSTLGDRLAESGRIRAQELSWNRTGVAIAEAIGHALGSSRLAHRPSTSVTPLAP